MAMTQDDYDQIKLHTHNGAQRQADGSMALAEFTRLGYLHNQDRMSQVDALGHRIAVESGSGRTRAFTNWPQNTAAPPVS